MYICTPSHTHCVTVFTGHAESEGVHHKIATQALPLNRDTVQQARTRSAIIHTMYIHRVLLVFILEC